MRRKIICSVVSALLICSNVTFSLQGEAIAAQGDDHEDIRSHLESVYRRFDQLGSLLDRSQFEADALIEALDFDGRRIVEFVQRQIHFQAYAGVLRGSEGTLVSRSGNALDQSLLLAQLLKDAGYEARIARSRLPREQARALMQSMAGTVNWLPTFGSRGEPDRVMNLLTPGRPVTPESARSELLQIAEQVQPILSETNTEIGAVIQAVQSALTPLEASFNSAAFEKKLLAEQEDYFWVEYRLNSSAKWQAAHPAFGDSAAPSLKASEHFKDKIPAKLQHRVRFQVFVETRLGEKSSVYPLMSPWERPASNAAYVPQTLMLMPVTDFMHDGKFDLEAGLASADFFAVFLNGAIAPGANVFSLEGLVGPPDALTGQGAFVATVAKKSMAATDALSSLGSESDDSEPVGGLNRLWFEFSIIAPGGDVTTLTRDVLNTTKDGQKIVQGRVVNADSWREQLQLALVQSREIVVSTGPVSPAFSLAKNLSFLESARDTIDKLLQLEEQGQLGPDHEVLKDLEPLPNYRAFGFFALANASTGIQADGASYLARPMIATFNRGYSKRNGNLYQFKQTDIVFNARRSLELDDQSIRKSARSAASQGVWDTYLEVLAARAPGDSTTRDSAFELLAARTEGLRYIAPWQESELARFDLEPSALLLAENELQSGYGLLLPDDIPQRDPAWWRVDTATGTLTGMMVGPGGYGGSTATEYIEVLSLVVTSTLMILGEYNCYATESGVDLFCCLVDTIFTGVLIAALTYAVTAMIVSVVATTGVVIIPGAAKPMAAGLAAKKTSQMVAAVIALMVASNGRVLLKYSDFRIKICGTYQ